MSGPAALWPLVRELFFNRKAIFQFIVRHRVGFMLTGSSGTMLLLLLFMTEQSIRQELRYDDNAKTIASLRHDAGAYQKTQKDLDVCRVDRDAAIDNYRTLAQAPRQPVSEPPSQPPKKPVVPAESGPALPNRDYDNYAKKRLQAIDGE